MDKITNIKNNLHKGIVTLFFISAISTCTGYVLEIFIFSKDANILLYNNLISLTISLFAIILYVYKKKNLKISYLLIIYTIIANIIVGTYLNNFDELRLNIFLRDSLFVMLFLSLAALALHKKHAIIISLLYLLSIIGITLITKNVFLKNSITLILVAVGTYGITMYYFVGLLNRTIRELEANSVLIEKQTTELEIKNKDLKNINITKDKFLSILAHDLKNPFSTIVGFANLLDSKINELSDDKKREYIKTIRITSEKTYNLLNNLLEWTRSQSGVIEYKPEKFEIETLLKKNIELFQEIGKNKDISISNSMQKNCSVFADKNMLDVVIRNLISNAIKFVYPGGEIQANCFTSENNIVVEISDTGIGIDEDDLKNLFKIDETKSTSGTSNETGSGLGLLLCKDFIMKCEGEIWVNSELGKGSVFSFSIPAIK
ncbi:MAG: HAMP domain-containing sensor histidine kinase [Bacteroidales bacterium]|jgi:signal transduction histidine kinase|nr:HAMP domain-containing sensor histidine kinase [Bacteroidales bacterium]